MKPVPRVAEPSPNPLPRWADYVLSGLGISLVFWTFKWIHSVIELFEARNWLGLIGNGLSLLMMALLGLVLGLMPGKRHPLVRRLMELIMWPLGLLVLVVGRWYTRIMGPILVFFFVLMVPLLIWKGLVGIGLQSPVLDSVLIYLGVVVSALVITYRGREVLGVFLRFFDPTEDHSGVLSVVRPQLMRIYVYALTASAYALSNVEKYSGTKLWNSPFWAKDQNLALDILLTFAVIDRVIDLWSKARQEPPQPKASRPSPPM